MESKKFVCIIDYGLGNVNSVKNTLQYLGFDSIISSDISLIQKSSHLILPGVGSFGDGMANLKKRNLIDLIKNEVIIKRKHILGICLGMQLFASKGFENGEMDGLDFIKGKVVKIDTSVSGLRLPQIGWNEVIFKGQKKITYGLNNSVYYFVHSYCFIPDDKNVVAGICNYGEDIVAIVESDNIYGTQFHPEKSHTDGLNLLKNFLDL